MLHVATKHPVPKKPLKPLKPLKIYEKIGQILFCAWEGGAVLSACAEAEPELPVGLDADGSRVRGNEKPARRHRYLISPVDFLQAFPGVRTPLQTCSVHRQWINGSMVNLWFKKELPVQHWQIVVSSTSTDFRGHAHKSCGCQFCAHLQIFFRGPETPSKCYPPAKVCLV